MTTSDGWTAVMPAAAGFADDLDARFDIARQAGVLPNVHGVVAVRAGKIFFERYLPGTDSAHGRPLGIVQFGADTLHDLRSVSKSIVGLLYGIALVAGKVPPPEAKLMEQFPEYADLAVDPARQKLTMRHVLTMTLGTDWDELSLPYTDPRNSEIAMDRAPDRFRYILERRVVGEPGERWTYCGGATALLARLIVKGTGQRLEDYARAALFEPLGIAQAEWDRDRMGEPIAASGLRLTPRDLARIGLVLLAKGQWKGRQVVPADWLATAFASAIRMPDERRFGYHWYLLATAMADGGSVRREETISAIGNGGQRLYVLPRLDLVVAITAGNYDAPDQWRPPLAVLRDVLLPARRS